MTNAEQYEQNKTLRIKKFCIITKI